MSVTFNISFFIGIEFNYCVVVFDRISKRSRDLPSSLLDKSSYGSPAQASPLNFGSPKKVSKLENMLDKLKKRKVGLPTN